MENKEEEGRVVGSLEKSHCSRARSKTINPASTLTITFCKENSSSAYRFKTWGRLDVC
ncbi:unnamed protein product [Moneuplotes crassus]|uniref:Uncharacterized protein n=1 Tax=Euplotes crassus TaxID=5936 RepID=A0AAD1Y4Q4_EUPCR|nr:unnamed protein product [Moneuplotes crassus]